MAVTSGQPAPFQPGFQEIDGTLLNAALAADQANWASGLVAVGTNQATSLQLNAQINTLGTSASGTGVALPKALAGGWCIVNVRAAGQTIAIYGQQGGTDTIDGTAGSTGVTCTVAHGAAYFICVSPGAWASFLLGAAST